MTDSAVATSPDRLAHSPLLDEIAAVGGNFDRIPSIEDLYLVERVLQAVQEHLSRPIFSAVREACSTGQPHSVTYEQIGQLVTWAQHVRDRLEEIETDAAAIALMAHEANAMAAGYHGDGPIFSQLGPYIIDPDGPYNEDQLEDVYRRIGWSRDA